MKKKKIWLHCSWDAVWPFSFLLSLFPQITWERPFPSEMYLGALSCCYGTWTFKWTISDGMQFSEGLSSKVSISSFLSSLSRKLWKCEIMKAFLLLDWLFFILIWTSNLKYSLSIILLAYEDFSFFRALSWFAVGCYYYCIKKYDQSRRYFR